MVRTMYIKLKIASGILMLGFLFPQLISCSKAKGDPGQNDDNDSSPAGYLTGVVKDQDGRPLKDVRIIVDHTIFFNSNIFTYTNAQGGYSIKLLQGSWYAFASHKVSYNGNVFSFYLHPNDSAGFGSEGGVRNFLWKLTGDMPQPLFGSYGGLVTIDNFPGVYIDETEVDFVFTPVGLLIDGSEGTVMHRRA